MGVVYHAVTPVVHRSSYYLFFILFYLYCLYNKHFHNKPSKHTQNRSHQKKQPPRDAIFADAQRHPLAKRKIGKKKKRDSTTPAQLIGTATRNKAGAGSSPPEAPPSSPSKVSHNHRDRAAQSQSVAAQTLAASVKEYTLQIQVSQLEIPITALSRSVSISRPDKLHPSISDGCSSNTPTCLDRDAK